MRLCATAARSVICENLMARLAEHNLGKVKTTMAFRPWEVVHREEYRSREDAIRRERYLKTGAGRRYLARVPGRMKE